MALFEAAYDDLNLLRRLVKRKGFCVFAQGYGLNYCWKESKR